MLHFLFATWVGGVVCSFVALLIAGPAIVNWINKEKKVAQEKVKHLQEELKKHNHNTGKN
jgi:gas vesicle protein